MVNVLPRGSATMTEVAKAAGVSLGTVSNVLNHPEKVRESLRDRVLAAIDELGFVRNSAARTLAAGSSNTVGMVMVDVSNTLYTDMARGAEAVTSASGMYLVLANAAIDRDRQRAYIDHFLQEQLAGILLTVYGSELGGVERILRAGGRVVLLDAPVEDSLDVCSVRVDYELSGYLAARHLIELGRRKLVFAGGELTTLAVAERYRGVQRAVAESGSVALERIGSIEIQTEDGETIAAELGGRPRHDLPDGIVAAADLVAMGLMNSLLSDGVRFPDDIAIIACDDNKSGRDSAVPISTVDLPGYAVGEAGMSLMLDELRSGEAHQHRKMVLPPTISARESSIGRLGAVPRPAQRG